MVDERAVSRIEEIRAEIARGIGTVERLTEHSLWSRTGPALFSGAKLSATPSFYPVYRWRDTYAWSVLPLVVLKGLKSFSIAAGEMPVPVSSTEI